MRRCVPYENVAPCKSGSEPTNETPTIALGKSATLTPEFCGFAEVRLLFGLSRSHLYRLADEGLIQSVVLRSKGKLRGRRLFVVESIRRLLFANLIGAVDPVNGGAE